MNSVFHAAAGAGLGALVLGPEAAPAELALCAVAGTSPDWDAVLLLIDKPIFLRFHRGLTHGFAGLALAALLAGGVLALWGGWDFARGAGLWLLAAGGHSASDLFNRSGVSLLAPFSKRRTRFPAVSWGDIPLTLGASAVALWAFLWPESGRLAAALGLGGYALYLRRRLRAPLLQNAVSRWWFRRVCRFAPPPVETSPAPAVLSRELGKEAR
ncbi:MAG: metal-dependent hydrolase [bacterium]